MSACQHGSKGETALDKASIPRYNQSVMSARSAARTKRHKPTRRGTRISRTRKSRPVWEELLHIARTIPEADLHKLPTDISVNHDHYLYGGHSE